HGVRKTAIRPNEVITEIRVPVVPARRSVFLKLGPRQALAISKVSVAVAAEARRGRFSNVRIALGAVAPTVVRVPEAEALLEGGTFEDPALEKAAELAAAVATPISDVRASAGYRSAMVRVLTRRALERLRAGEPGGDAVIAGQPPALPVLSPA